MKSPRTQQGFTIIETLVAITILMISIVGPLTIAHKSLLVAVYARDQVTASYLAQDAMEYLKNVRDNNKIQNQNWYRGFDMCSASESNPQNFCTVDTVSGDPADPLNFKITDGINATQCVTVCVLYKDSSGKGYVHGTGTGTRTQFKRYFYQIPRQNTDKMRLVVVVEWSNGLVSNEVTYENEIFDIRK